jgi:hypothetical protein
VVELGDLVASVNFGSEIKLLILLVNIVLLQELGALDLVRLQQLQIPLYSPKSVRA